MGYFPNATLIYGTNPYTGSPSPFWYSTLPVMAVPSVGSDPNAPYYYWYLCVSGIPTVGFVSSVNGISGYGGNRGVYFSIGLTCSPYYITNGVPPHGFSSLQVFTINS